MLERHFSFRSMQKNSLILKISTYKNTPLLLKVILSCLSSGGCTVKSGSSGSASVGGSRCRDVSPDREYFSSRERQEVTPTAGLPESTESHTTAAFTRATCSPPLGRPAAVRAASHSCTISASKTPRAHAGAHARAHRNTDQCLRRGINTIHHIPTRWASFPSHLT